MIEINAAEIVASLEWWHLGCVVMAAFVWNLVAAVAEDLVGMAFKSRKPR